MQEGATNLVPPLAGADWSVPPLTAGASPVERTTSPTIDRLREDLATDPTALDRFWMEIGRQGTPLIEHSASADPDRVVVTFVGRGNDSITDVALFANKLTDPDTFESCCFTRLDGTDVWWLALHMDSSWRSSYQLAFMSGSSAAPRNADDERRRQRVIAASSPDAASRIHRWFDAFAVAGPDPLARQQLGRRLSIVSLPAAPAQPWVRSVSPPACDRSETIRPSAPDGIAAREVVVHRPPIDPQKPWPVLVLLDGDTWQDLDLLPALDAAMTAGAIPPMLTVFVPALDATTREHDLTCNPAFVAYLADHVLAEVTARWPVTDAAMKTVIAGQSLGGLTALFSACARRDRFGGAICQSGSFWWPNDGSPVGAEWLTGALDPSVVPTGSVYVEVGTLEWVLVEPTRRLRDALERAGADVTYREYTGGHDRACWRGSIVEGIAAVTRSWSMTSTE